MIETWYIVGPGQCGKTRALNQRFGLAIPTGPCGPREVVVRLGRADVPRYFVADREVTIDELVFSSLPTRYPLLVEIPDATPLEGCTEAIELHEAVHLDVMRTKRLEIVLPDYGLDEHAASFLRPFVRRAAVVLSGSTTVLHVTGCTRQAKVGVQRWIEREIEERTR